MNLWKRVAFLCDAGDDITLLKGGWYDPFQYCNTHEEYCSPTLCNNVPRYYNQFCSAAAAHKKLLCNIIANFSLVHNILKNPTSESRPFFNKVCSRASFFLQHCATIVSISSYYLLEKSNFLLFKIRAAAAKIVQETLNLNSELSEVDQKWREIQNSQVLYF